MGFKEFQLGFRIKQNYRKVLSCPLTMKGFSIGPKDAQKIHSDDSESFSESFSHLCDDRIPCRTLAMIASLAVRDDRTPRRWR